MGFLLVIPQVVNAASSRQIEEVIVTAERQEASVQDTSISITAFTSEMLDDFGIRNQEDLQNFVPATTIQPYDATVRGVGRNFRALGGDPGVSTYMNGVYSEDLPTATHAGFWDVQRIEVLRGPQGTLYGRNAVGGAINILYKQPTQELDYAFKVIGGSHGTEEYYGMINGPIIADVLSARFNFGVRDRDGVIDEIGPYDDLDSLGRQNMAFQLQWTPTENLEFNVRTNLMENDRIFGGANGGGLVVLNEFDVGQRDTTHLVPGFRRIDVSNTDNYFSNNWYDASQPVLNFTDPITGANVTAQHNRAGVDVAEFDGFQNAAASLDGFNQTSQASADRYNDCVFPGDLDGGDVCAATNGINREEFNQQGVQFSTIWDVSDNLTLKYIYGYNKLSYERTTDDDNTASLFHDRQFYVNHEALYESHEIQAFYDFTDNFSITVGIFDYDSVIDQRGDFYSTLNERRYIDAYQDNTGLAPIFFGTAPMATLHAARDACQVADPAPSCDPNFAVDNNPNTNGASNNNLYISTWQGDDGTNPDLDVVHGINSVGSDLLYHTQTHKEAFAAYAQTVWDINERFTLTTGIRYAEDEVTAEENLFRYIEAAGGVVDSILANALGFPAGGLASYNIINGGLVADASHAGGFRPTELAVNGGIPAAVSVYRPFHRKDDKITWRVNLDWNFSDSGMMYFSATTGTRAGGHNLVFFSATPSYDPENLLAWEIGLKQQYFNDSLQVNASVYLYDYETIHTVAVEVVPPLTDFGGTASTTTSVLEAPGADIYGFEIEVLWLTTDNLTLGGNFSYTPSEYTGDLFIQDPSGYENPKSLFTNFEGLTQNIKGNKVLQVPEMKYTGWASYNFPLSGGSSVEVFGVYSYVGDVYYTPFENDNDKAESYGRVDLRATWTSSESNWVVTGFVNNILDDVGVLQVLRQGEGENFRRTAGTTLPRMYGVELSYSLK
jgi:outer membrane receptor protein involved in Fe transport